MDWLLYWYMFPVSVLIATIAMSTGIGGAVFFSPIFMLLLKLEPATAVGTALITELFGFTSGLSAYMRAKLIDYKLGANLLIVAVPLGIAGALLGDYVADALLKGIFGAGILFIGWQLYTAYRNEKREAQEVAKTNDPGFQHNNCLVDKDGNTYYYTIKQRWLGRTLAGIGGFFVGMISVGLAEILEYRLVAQCRVPTPVAVATSIFVVVVTILLASGTHAYQFIQHADAENLQRVASLVMFTVPGVLIGGQIGPWVQRNVDAQLMKLFIAIVFGLVGVLMLSVTFL